MTILDKEPTWFDTPWGKESQCPYCGSSVSWQDCDACGGSGFSGHECGEDTCCCLDPEDNVECDICNGEGGWYECLGGCGNKAPKPIEIAAEVPSQTKLVIHIQSQENQKEPTK